MATYVLTIEGVTRTAMNGWTIKETANGLSVFNFAVLSETGTYRPALDDEVVFTENGTRIFGGHITELEEAGVGGETRTAIVTNVTVQDYTILADRRHFFGTVPAAATLLNALDQIEPIMGGATVHASQATGMTFAEDVIYPGVKLRDVLNDFTLRTGGWIWEVDYDKFYRMYTPGTFTAPFDITATNEYAIGDVIVKPTRLDYANRVYVYTATLSWTADDAAEQAANGIWEVLYQAPDETTIEALEVMAVSILSRTIVTKKQVRYFTRSLGLRVGMTQVITLPKRNISNTFIITDIDTTQAEGDTLLREVSLIEGTTYRSGWQEKWRQLMTGSQSTGTIIGGGGGGVTSRYAYFLGGNGSQAVEDPTPTWISASAGANHVQLDTAARGSTSGTVYARLRALNSGVTVQARLYNISDSVAVSGTSSVVSSTSWTQVSFGVTLTSGTKLYELQLLPSVANEGVLGVGYIE